MTAPIRPAMTEAQMLSGLKSAAKGLGFSVYHNTYAIGSDRGFPDVVICGYGHVMFLELKGPKPKVYDEQRAWISRLLSAGQDARFVYPKDYDSVLEDLQTIYQQALVKGAS